MASWSRKQIAFLFIYILKTCSSFVQQLPALSITNAKATRYNLKHTASRSSSSRLYAEFSPPKTVGVVGTGFVSVLTSKLCSLAGYKTWVLHPPGDEDTVRRLLAEEDTFPEGLTLVSATDTDGLISELSNTQGLIIAADNPDAPMDESVIEFLGENAPSLERIVLMSRNLNKQNMGFFVKASKMSANPEVWYPDDDIVKKYQAIERKIQTLAKDRGVTYVIARAGTLKGGACGDVDNADSYCPKYLTKEFYDMTKKDIVTWQLLFDCRTRGVKLYKGDTMPGPGNKAVFTATGYEKCEGDTSRAAIAEVMVRALSRTQDMANIDFAVGTEDTKELPTEEQWEALFAQVL